MILAKDATLRLLDGLIDENFGGSNARGCVMLERANYSEIDRCTFRRNRCFSTSNLVILDSTNVAVTNSLFHHNRSEVGSAVAVSSGS